MMHLVLGRLAATGVTLALLAASGTAAATDRQADGLQGPAQSVFTETKTYERRDDGTVVADEPRPTLEITYDQSGLRTQVAEYTLGRRDLIITFEHDDNRRLIGEAHGNVEGDILGRWTYRHDDAGNMVEAVFVQVDGTVVRSRQASYDSDGNVVEDVEYGPNDEELVRRQLVRDAKGRVIEAIRFENGERVSRLERDYDADGNLVEERRYTRWDTLLGATAYDHDDHGNLVEIAYAKPYGAGGENEVFQRYTYSYVYDDHGNWIERQETQWLRFRTGAVEQPSETTYRTITYFE